MAQSNSAPPNIVPWSCSCTCCLWVQERDNDYTVLSQRLSSPPTTVFLRSGDSSTQGSSGLVKIWQPKIKVIRATPRRGLLFYLLLCLSLSRTYKDLGLCAFDFHLACTVFSHFSPDFSSTHGFGAMFRQSSVSHRPSRPTLDALEFSKSMYRDWPRTARNRISRYN